MSRLFVRVGFVLWWMNWFWVVDRRIGNSWRLHCVRTDQYRSLTHSQLSVEFQSARCTLVARSTSVIDQMTTNELRQFARALFSNTGRNDGERG